MSDSTRVPAQSTTIAAARDRIWELLEDPSALQRVLPGCEALEPAGEGRYAAVLATRAGFLTVRADATIALRDVARPSHVTLDIAGVPRGIGGDFHVSVPIELEEIAAATTRVTYDMEVELTGRIAALGGSLVRGALHGQIADLVKNVERELGDGRRRGSGH